MSACLAGPQTAGSITQQINSVREPLLFARFPSTLHRSVEKNIRRLFASGQTHTRCKRSLTGGPVSAPGLTASLVPAGMPARALCQHKESPARMMFTSAESRGKMAAC